MDLAFDTDEAKLGRADVFESVSGHGWRPDRRAFDGLHEGSAIHKYNAGGISADAVAPAQQQKGAGPAMGMQRCCITRGDPDLEHPYRFVFKEQNVVARCGNQGIKLVRPLLICRHK